MRRIGAKGCSGAKAGSSTSSTSFISFVLFTFLLLLASCSSPQAADPGPGSADWGLEQLASSSKKVKRTKEMKDVDEVEEPALAPLHPLAPILRIDHLTEYSGVFGARCTAEVGRTAVKSLIGQDGEGESFLGVLGYAQV